MLENSDKLHSRSFWLYYISVAAAARLLDVVHVSLS